jgi:hypothetical protein
LMYSAVDERHHEAARDVGESVPVQHKLLSRSWTHNEQLMVCACGIILARKTFFKSESVTKVKVSCNLLIFYFIIVCSRWLMKILSFLIHQQDFIREVFPQEMPQVIFYDNACGLYSHIRTNPEDLYAFCNTLLPVDAFRIKSHKESHTTLW